MRKTYTDFSQLSKGMFRRETTPVEMKPQPPKKSADDDALAYFGIGGMNNGKRGVVKAGSEGQSKAFGGADEGRIQALEADMAALRAESVALDAARAEAARKADELERQLAAERQVRASAEIERDRACGEVLRLKDELEDALTTLSAQPSVAEPVHEMRVVGLLKPPSTAEAFPNEVREYVLAVLSEGLEAAWSSGRERRAAVLEEVLVANKSDSELDRRRKELKQIIKDAGSFVDARTIAALEKIGFKCVSGNKHWKLDYADIRMPISKTPSDYRAALNMATDIANRCF